MGRLDGKAAIVTGAGQSQGRGIARRFASEGAAVLATTAYEAFRAADPAYAAALLQQNRMRHMGDAERDIGSAALFLASDDAGYLSANTVSAGGGVYISGVAWVSEPD